MDNEKQLLISLRIPNNFREGDTLFDKYKTSLIRSIQEKGATDYEIRVVPDPEHPSWNLMEGWV